MDINVSRRTIGINFNDRNEAEIVVWSPEAESVAVQIERGETNSPRLIPLNKQQYGYWQTKTSAITPGTPYRISVNGDDALPDPASLFQPAGVHGPSVALDIQHFSWSDKEWRNIPLHSYIIYELHTGTFSPEHNFDGIRKKLDYLVELGVNAIEIMPIGQFPGERNWGYDGVYPFAVQHSYGGPQKLQELVNECHLRGIAVILDVIYNHLGPEGNYLANFGPYFTDKYRTPWGQALNFDDAWCDGVREYFIENALMWFRDFHVDALRMDAVHAIKDLSPNHILKVIREKVDQLSATTGIPYYLIAELDLNNPVFINPAEKGGYGLNAQWIDEFHHALRVCAGQPNEGYYSDFNGITHLAKSYRDAYVFDGQFSPHRKKFFGVKTDNPGHQFVVFSQNHDHVGNRMLGERSSQLASFEMCKLMVAAVMVSPYLPMLFMGEEYAESNPFFFFIDHSDSELAALVSKGRKEEFSSFHWQGDPPDPRLEKTFSQSTLQWDLLQKTPHTQMFAFYKKLIALKKNEPALKNTERRSVQIEEDPEAKTLLLRRYGNEQEMVCLMNFSAQQREMPFHASGYVLLLDSSSTEWNGPGSIDENANQRTSLQPESIMIYARNY